MCSVPGGIDFHIYLARVSTQAARLRRERTNWSERGAPSPDQGHSTPPRKPINSPNNVSFCQQWRVNKSHLQTLLNQSLFRISGDLQITSGILPCNKCFHPELGAAICSTGFRRFSEDPSRLSNPPSIEEGRDAISGGKGETL